LVNLSGFIVKATNQKRQFRQLRLLHIEDEEIRTISGEGD